ncbi:hypothetical protein D3C79_652380 [compost metagenome]
MNQEYPLPVGERHDNAADRRPEPQPNAKNDAPYAEGLATLFAALKLMRQCSHLANQHGATRHALHKAAQDQHRRAVGQAAEQGGETESGNGDDENSPAAKTVRQRSGGHHHGGAGQGVGIHNPLHIAEITV